jgi:hypothetical protein
LIQKYDNDTKTKQEDSMGQLISLADYRKNKELQASEYSCIAITISYSYRQETYYIKAYNNLVEGLILEGKETIKHNGITITSELKLLGKVEEDSFCDYKADNKGQLITAIQQAGLETLKSNTYLDREGEVCLKY